MRIQRGKRLVEHQQLGLVHKYARERHALLLAAGELRRVVLLKSRQLHELYVVGEQLLTLRFVLFPLRAAEDILPHGHVGEEGVVLEEVAHLSLLRLEVYTLLAVEKRDSVENNFALVGALYARYAAESHALSAAGWAEYAHYPVFGFKLY